MERVLKDSGLYKTRLLSVLQDNDDIKYFLMGDNYSDEAWYGNEDDETDTGIIYKQILPYLYMDETQTDVKSYICCQVDVISGRNSTKDLKIIIWAVCHKDIMRCTRKGYLGTRADMILDAVEWSIRSFEEECRKSKKAPFGIGKLDFGSATSINSINNSYSGRQLILTAYDFKYKEG